jgi:putative DNA primase/helicase
MGEYAGQVPIESLMAKPGSEGISNDIASLQGLRFVTSSEAEEGKKLAEGKVKQITGTGRLKARFLYGEYFEFEPTFKIFIDANHKPEIRGTDQAIWSRIKLVPFTVEIKPEKMDKKLLPKLRTEAAGILAWAVRGCLEWQAHGLVEPVAVKGATQSYREEMDTVARFIADACVIGEGQISSKTLHDAYKEWCKERGEEAVSQSVFGRTLTKKGLHGVKVGGTRSWSGIAFKLQGPLFEET